MPATELPVAAKAAAAVPPAAVKPVARDRSCYLSVEALKKRRAARESVTLVDVRSVSEYEKYRIPGSLNIPLSQVKAKGFLKGSPAVLINDGRSMTGLERACRELKQNGFQISVLEGGLYAWHDAKGEIAGDIFALRDLDRLTPEEIFLERRYNDWLVVDLTVGTRKAVYPWLPARRVHLKKIQGKEFMSSLRAVVERHRKLDPETKVLILGDTDAEYDRIMPVVRRTGLKQVFYLAGGLAGYGDYMNKQMAMWNQKDQPLRLPACRG